MRLLRLAALAGLAALGLSAPVAHAQTPARFPAVPVDQIEGMLRNAPCGNQVSAIARTVAQAEGWRGFALRVCGPDDRPAGAVVAWMRRSGQREIVVALPDGTPLDVPEDGRVNWGDLRAQFTVFGIAHNGAPLGCAVPRANRLNEPFASALCVAFDAQGNIIPRR